jgi:hypothetical protein
MNALDRERWLLALCQAKAAAYKGTMWAPLYRERAAIHAWKLAKLERGEYVFTG